MDEVDAQRVQADKLTAVRKMAEGIAHEINNPLAILLQITGWIKDLLTEEGYPASTKCDELIASLEKIEDNVERIRKIVHGLLGQTRGIHPRLESVDINETLSSAIALLENRAQSRRISLWKALAPGLPFVTSDPSELEQVFLNLISNSLDAIGSNGDVQVRTFREGACIVVEVADSGPGIPVDQQKHIFEPFFSTKPPGKGMGLGLWISYTIVQRIGGRMSFENIPAKGCIFTVKLPAG
jgi:two-component system NtrC family sensor kinase